MCIYSKWFLHLGVFSLLNGIVGDGRGGGDDDDDNENNITQNNGVKNCHFMCYS
jgi:hypothetical protein